MTPLHQFGEMLRQSLLQIPLGVARVLFVATLAALLIWVLTLPAPTPPSAERKKIPWTENLKLWAAVALVIQLLIYILV